MIQARTNRFCLYSSTFLR